MKSTTKKIQIAGATVAGLSLLSLFFLNGKAQTISKIVGSVGIAVAVVPILNFNGSARG